MGKSGKALTPYQQFVKSNYSKYGGDFKKIGAAWRAKSGTTTESKPKPSRSVTTTTEKKPATTATKPKTTAKKTEEKKE